MLDFPHSDRDLSNLFCHRYKNIIKSVYDLCLYRVCKPSFAVDMKLRSILYLSLLVSLTSCFEIIEEVELKDDGSGSYEYTLNVSQSRTKLDQIMRLDSINGYKVPQKTDLKKPLEELIAKSKEISGISNVSKVEDFENYIFSFSCDFKDIDALNRLVAELRRASNDKRTDIPEVHFSYDASSKRYVRNGDYTIKADFGKMKEADRVIFDGATFTSIFRSDNELTSFSNDNARISPNKKALMLRMDVLDLMHEKVSMGNTIHLQ